MPTVSPHRPLTSELARSVRRAKLLAGATNAPTSQPTAEAAPAPTEATAGELLSEVAAILKDFDALPDAAFVRLPVVKALFGVSGPTIWRWVNDDKRKFPPPRKLSLGVTAWKVADIKAALESA